MRVASRRPCSPSPARCRTRAMRPTSFRPRSTSITCSARSFSSLAQLGDHSRVLPRASRRAGACRRSAAPSPPTAPRARSSSGELPTSSTPSSTRWYMYGDGLSARSARYSASRREVVRHAMRRASSTWKASPAAMYSLMRSTSRDELLARRRRLALGRLRIRAQVERRQRRSASRSFAIVRSTVASARRIARAASPRSCRRRAARPPRRAPATRRLSMITSASVKTNSASGAHRFSRRRRRQPLDQPHGVVAEEAHGAAPERAELRARPPAGARG